MLLEDNHACWLKAIFLHDDKLRLDIYSLRSFGRASIVLNKTLKLESWNSDYIGEVGFEARRYQVGIRLVHGEELRLEAYFRGRHLHTRTDPRLEVVK
jgi:hypothetical protein